MEIFISKLGRLIAAIVAALALVLTVNAPVGAVNKDGRAEDFIVLPNSPSAPQLDLSAEEQRALASAWGVSASEASATIAGQNEFGVVVAELEARFKSSFFSSGWESGEGYRAWISFVGEPPAEAIGLIKSLPFPTQVRFDGPATQIVLQALVAEISATLTRAGIREADVSYDAHTGDILAVYESNATLDEHMLEEEIASLQAVAPVPIRLKLSADVGNALQSVIGGKTISIFGTPDCTTGFTVYKSGTPAVLTAAHCPNGGFSIAGSSGTVYMGTEYLGSQGDFQWMATTDSIANRVQIHSNGTTKAITAVSSASVGSGVCVFGAFSATLACATATNTNTCSTIGGVTTCQLVKLDAAITIGGDSGAPWSVGPAAYGIHRGLCGGYSCYSKVQNAVTQLGVLIKLI